MNDFQQVFLRWLDHRRGSLKIQPLIEESRGSTLLFSFEKVTSHVALVLMTDSVRVNCYKGEFDLLYSSENLFVREICAFKDCRVEGDNLDRFTCTAHRHERIAHRSSESEERVLAAHCFDPLARWINDELEPAHYLLFAESEFGESASLVRKNEDESPIGDDETSYESISIKFRRPRKTDYVSKFYKQRRPY